MIPQPLQNFTLSMLYSIRSFYLEQVAKTDEHQKYLDSRIVLYSREIYGRENDMLAAMNTDFTNLLNDLNNGSNVPITIN
ncbi:MAG: hypothetical protein V4722_04440 [Bacteroidota bacterium]